MSTDDYWKKQRKRIEAAKAGQQAINDATPGGPSQGMEQDVKGMDATAKALPKGKK